MKTERRHELQTNVLAAWLNQYIDQLRPYGRHFAFGALAIAAAIVVALFFANDRSSRISAGWNDYFAASYDQDPNRLRAVATDHAGTDAALWAKLTEADIELSRGIRDLYTDRTSADSALERAAAGYDIVVTAATDGSVLQSSARFGLAQAYECSGELDKAVELYGLVASSSHAESALMGQAVERKQRLESPEMRRFYNWFGNQKPAPPSMPSATGLGLPPELPSDLGLISDEPDISFPSTSSEPDPADGESADAPESSTEEEASADESPE